jgi:hypothetical protein
VHTLKPSINQVKHKMGTLGLGEIDDVTKKSKWDHKKRKCKMKHNFCLKSILDFLILCCMKTHSMKTSPMHGWCVSFFFRQFMWACESFDVCFYHKKPRFLALCEAFLHTFNMKICTHKTRLEVELLCNCSITNKVVHVMQRNSLRI